MTDNSKDRHPRGAAPSNSCTAHVSLEIWADRKYDPPPHANTLRAWARDGKIIPTPIKSGRTYYVHPQARHVNELLNASRLTSRLDLP